MGSQHCVLFFGFWVLVMVVRLPCKEVRQNTSDIANGMEYVEIQGKQERSKNFL